MTGTLTMPQIPENTLYEYLKDGAILTFIVGVFGAFFRFVLQRRAMTSAEFDKASEIAETRVTWFLDEQRNIRTEMGQKETVLQMQITALDKELQQSHVALQEVRLFHSEEIATWNERLLKQQIEHQEEKSALMIELTILKQENEKLKIELDNLTVAVQKYAERLEEHHGPAKI